jgi:hypothetical protein
LTLGLAIYLVLVYLTNPWARKLFRDAIVYVGLVKSRGNVI